MSLEIGLAIRLTQRASHPYSTNSYGRDQSCAMLLGFASGNTFLDNDVPLGFDPGIVSSSTVNPELALLAKKLFYDVGERPIWAERAYGVSGQSGRISVWQ